MKVEIKDLEIGDEILVPRNGRFLYLKVLRAPQLSKLGYRFDPSLERWKSVKCAVHREKRTHQYTRTYIRKWWEYTCDNNYNTTMNADLNRKDIWLVSKENK